MSDAESKVLEQLKALHLRYAEELPGKITVIREAMTSLQKDCDAETLKTTHRNAHSLAGSGATFGYPEVSEAARALEKALKAVLEDAAAAAPALPAGVEGLMANLEEVARGAVAKVSEPVVTQPLRGSGPADSPRLIFVVDDDTSVAREERLQYEMHGYRVEEFHDFSGLEEAVRRQQPDAIIMDVMFPEGEMSGVAHVQALRESLGDLPSVIFVSQRDDLEARLGAVRAGAAAYFTKPVDVASVVQTLDRMTARVDQSPFRIMIVDDDESLAFHTSLLLQRAGIKTHVLTDPALILDELATFQPELILMDLYLPNCTGIELAAVIRQQEVYIGIPIVFLSVETDIKKHLDGMRAGGDDFLLKPVDPEHLLATLEARVRRGRAITALMVRDGLTGLLNHSFIQEQLSRELVLQDRHAGVLSYVLIDLDHFKSVNDQYGHAAGDQVLVSLAGLLRQRFRKTDLIGRYGGEEFAVVLLGTDNETAIRLVDEARQAFAAIRHQSGGREFSVTFSAGVATAPPLNDLSTLQGRADEALYRAKEAGRNRVERADHGDA